MSSEAGWGAWIRSGHLPRVLDRNRSGPETRAPHPSMGAGGGHELLAASGCSSASHEFIWTEHRRSKHFNLAVNIKIISGHSRSDSPIVSTHGHFTKLLHIAPLGCRQTGLPATHTPCVRSPLPNRRGALARFDRRRLPLASWKEPAFPNTSGFHGCSFPTCIVSLSLLFLDEGT